jgi:hypothetical protein
MAVAARPAAGEDPVPVVRAARLSAALTGLARELPGARREIAVPKRENLALRARLNPGARDG